MKPYELRDMIKLPKSFLDEILDEIDAENIVEAEDEEAFEDEVCLIRERARITIFYANELIRFMNALTYEEVKR